jgi:hypothetical protein
LVQQDLLKMKHGRVVRPVKNAPGKRIKGDEVHFALDPPEQFGKTPGVFRRVIHTL